MSEYYLGSRKADAVYLGSTQLYPSSGDGGGGHDFERGIANLEVDTTAGNKMMAHNILGGWFQSMMGIGSQYPVGYDGPEVDTESIGDERAAMGSFSFQNYPSNAIVRSFSPGHMDPYYVRLTLNGRAKIIPGTNNIWSSSFPSMYGSSWKQTGYLYLHPQQAASSTAAQNYLRRPYGWSADTVIPELEDRLASGDLEWDLNDGSMPPLEFYFRINPRAENAKIDQPSDGWIQVQSVFGWNSTPSTSHKIAVSDDAHLEAHIDNDGDPHWNGIP